MELLDKNLEKLKDVWKDAEDRQHAKIVIAEAITRGTDITVKQLDEILSALDDILLDTPTLTVARRDTAL